MIINTQLRDDAAAGAIKGTGSIGIDRLGFGLGFRFGFGVAGTRYNGGLRREEIHRHVQFLLLSWGMRRGDPVDDVQLKVLGERIRSSVGTPSPPLLYGHEQKVRDLRARESKGEK